MNTPSRLVITSAIDLLKDETEKGIIAENSFLG